MSANKILNIGPIALTTTLTTNLLNCAITALAGPIGYTQTQPYLLVRKLRVTNKSNAPVSFSFWKGATGANVAGTEIGGTGTPVAPNGFVEVQGLMRFDAVDFLVGGASVVTALTLTIESEIGMA
jgi:hypothetical protein